MATTFTDPVDTVGMLKREYGHYYDAFPRLASDAPEGGFFLENQMFGSVDAELLYAMVRHVKPRLIVEVGAGWTTLLVLKAIEDMKENEEKAPKFESVDPRAPGFVYKRDGVHINTKRLQEMNILYTLRPGDMLLCDTSHVRVEGHEVDAIIKMLPELKGVVVHFHDIFLPEDYPAQWADRGYDEQYHLKDFLDEHPEWQVIIDANRIHKEMPDAFKGAIASYDQNRPVGPGSFWMMQPAPVVKRPAKKTMRQQARTAQKRAAEQ
jgi:hypothetical protein